MKTQSVKTWKERPERETSTAALLPPEERDERAPPTACRTRDRMSHGYGKISESVLPDQGYISTCEARANSHRTIDVSKLKDWSIEENGMTEALTMKIQ